MSRVKELISECGENVENVEILNKFPDNIYSKVKFILRLFYDIAGFFILWVTLHFIAANLYSRFCAEQSLFGYIKSIFIAQVPHCVAMRWIIYNGGNVINSMWLSIAVWFTTKIFNKII